MTPDEIIKKGPKPTSQLFAMALTLDLYFILKFGKSPAFFELNELITNISSEIVYLVIILSSVGLFLILPLFASVFLIGSISYFSVKKLLNRSRLLKVSLYLMRRKYVQIDLVQSYLKDHPNDEIKEKIAKREKMTVDSALHLGTQTAILVLLVTLALISSAQKPNFLMLVCGYSDAKATCLGYSVLLAAAILQSFFLLATSMSAFFKAGKISIDDLPIKKDDLKEYKGNETIDSYTYSSIRNWMRGPSKH